MARIKDILKNPRVIFLIIVLVLGTFAINPQPWNEGVSIKAVSKNSAANLAGIENPKQNIVPMKQELITAVNNNKITSLDEYYKLTEDLEINQTIKITTNKQTYRLKVRPLVERIVYNETEKYNVTKLVNQTINKTINGTTVNVTKQVNKTVTEERKKITENIIGIEPLGLAVGEAPKTNIRTGLDLQGGTRVLLKPTEPVDAGTMDLVVDSLKERLNVYGLGDVRVTQVSDRPDVLGQGTQYVLVEIAGATEEEVKDLVAKQGKFEAQIANKTVFKGGQDITYVCRTAECSGLHPQIGCSKNEGGHACSFLFEITLSPDAAQTQAELTKPLKVIGDQLEEKLILYLDGEKVDELGISAGLRGRAVTEIAITGGGEGITQEAAVKNTLQNMKRLQTILITGSLPVKLEMERIDNISPTLGREFLDNAFLVGFLSLIVVAITLIISYKSFKVAIPIIITSLSEVYLTISMAAIIGWNVDLAAIAGIILAVGTGVDDQIVILDEAIKGTNTAIHNWKEKLKRAFFIIMSAYFTTVVAMLPLLFAGAGLLKGFAITTILGVSIGVFITRPAFAAIAQWITQK